MAALSDSDLVAVWSVARQMHPVVRGVALLRAVSAEESFEALAALPIGRRDARLLALREQWFGAQLAAVTACPSCGLRVEADVPVSALQSNDVARTTDGVRAPDTRDLLEIANAPDEESARAMLLARCAPDVANDDDAVLAIAQADPGADANVRLMCPECGYAWESGIDIAAFLWSDVDVAARRALRDVHVLASAYGWSEEAILSIPAARRQLYLEMVST